MISQECMKENLIEELAASLACGLAVSHLDKVSPLFVLWKGMEFHQISAGGWNAKNAVGA